MLSGIRTYHNDTWKGISSKVYKDGRWVDLAVRKYDKNAWYQLYPLIPIERNDFITNPEDATRHKPVMYSNDSNVGWDFDRKVFKIDEYAQGRYDIPNKRVTSFGGLNSVFIPGNGTINTLKKATFSGIRTETGNWWLKQKIAFGRSDMYPIFTEKPGAPNVHDMWYCQLQPFSRSTMTWEIVDIPLTDEYGSQNPQNCLNWLNHIDGDDYLYFGGLDKDYDHLAIKEGYHFKFSYVYMGIGAIFKNMNDPATNALFSNKIVSYGNSTTYLQPNLKYNEGYHSMILYPNEVNMSLKEVIEYRTKYNIPDIDDNNILTDFKPRICIKSSLYLEEKNSIQVMLDYLKDEHVVQYSIDKQKYLPMKTSTLIDCYEGELPKEYDKTKDSIYVRVVNTKTDSIDFEHVHDARK